MNPAGVSRFARFLVGGLLIAAAALGQARRPLTHKDYDAWRTMNTVRVSHDGKYLAYSWMPYEGDGEAVVRELATGKEFRIPVGAQPPPPVINPAEVEPGQERPAPGIRMSFTSDSKWLVVSIYPRKEEMAQARKAKKKPEEMPKQGLMLVELSTGKQTPVERVKSFQVPEKGGSWVAYLKEAPLPAPKSAEAAKKPAADSGDDQEAAATGESTSGPRKEYGTELVLRDLSKSVAAERSFANVSAYSFAKDGRTLAYTVSSRKEEENGVFHLTPGDGAAPVSLLSGKGKYQKLTWNRDQTQMVFLSDKDDATSKTPRQKIYRWDRKAAQASELISDTTPGLGAGLVVSDKGTLAFSRDGRRLYVPAGKPPKAPKDPAPADERVALDLWHWQDGLIQPMQKVRANQERNRTYAAVYHLSENRLVQAADDRMPTVSFSDSGLTGLGSSDVAYRRMVDFDGTYADLYAVDTTNGQRKLIWRKLRSGFGGAGSLSPDGSHALVFQNRHWHLVRLADGATRNLTGSLPVAFHQEDDDTPDPAGAYGAGGWTEDGKSALVYDEFDIWQLPVDGSAPKTLTAGEGRKQKIVFRVQRLAAPGEEDEDQRYLDPTKPLTLRAVNDVTRASGYYRVSFQGGAPQRLLWGDANYQVRAQARDASVLLIAASRFDQFPDLHLTDLDFRTPRKITDGDAQRRQFAWGKAELIDFRNVDGVPLRASLFKPDNFDPNRKYPLMVYIYEKLSQNVHNFVNPTPGTSINLAYYVSNGYVVLMPDIVYTVGNPGQSALKCVLPAIQEVVDRGFINEAAIGIQGHSWGGYQIAYMVTQTNRFRAAEAGAPVGNMTSAYSGIRWGSGLPRQFQYEQTQSRIGPPLYEAPHKYLENSPVFHIGRVQTPLLILHNDQDDAVPWYQGIELFLALRRNNKEAYLLNYNGEFHGLRRRQNQRDYTVRMQQFFDHFLKGAAKPEWMQKGVPFIERDEEKERFRSQSAGATSNE